MHHLGAFLGKLWFQGVVLVSFLFLASCGSSQGDSRAAPVEPVRRGEVLYQANCQSCHGGATGGSLRDIPPPHNTNGHTWHHADQQLIDIVLNGVSFPAYESKMPPFKDKLTEADVKAILAYIKTWWTDEQRHFQVRATQSAC